MDRAGQFQSPSGRLHAPIVPYEQRIIEHVAKAIKRLAYGRLTEPIALGRPGDVAFRHQRVEHDQEIEVDCS
jgi:hypothetical protein